MLPAAPTAGRSERGQPNSCGRPQFTAQTWLLRPGPLRDLEVADKTIRNVQHELAQPRGIPEPGARRPTPG